MKFVERQEFRGDPARVWERLSNLETIPTYWHGTRELKVAQSGGRVVGDIVFAFGGRGKAEITVDDRRRTLAYNYLEGPFKGTQTVVVKDNVIQAEWDVTFKGAYRVLGPLNASHFRSGTRHALMRLCEGQTAESEAPSATTS